MLTSYIAVLARKFDGEMMIYFAGLAYVLILNFTCVNNFHPLQVVCRGSKWVEIQII